MNQLIAEREITDRLSYDACIANDHRLELVRMKVLLSSPQNVLRRNRVDVSAIRFVVVVGQIVDDECRQR